MVASCDGKEVIAPIESPKAAEPAAHGVPDGTVKMAIQ
jgi:hypothetical protein